MVEVQNNHPVIIVRFASEITIKDLDDVLTLLQMASFQGKFGLVVDASKISNVPVELIFGLSHKMRKITDLESNWAVEAIVIQSISVQFITFAVMVMTHLPTDVRTFDRIEDATSWCEKILRQSNTESKINVSLN